MFDCKCFQRNNLSNYVICEPDSFSLPDPLPNWPPGKGFASGRITLSPELEVIKIVKFRFVWGYGFAQDRKKGVSFYKPMGLPRGFHCLGHYCQANKHPINGFVLVAREVTGNVSSPALAKPVDYSLVWTADDQHGEVYEGCGFFWLPIAPEGYKAMGFLVTSNSDRPQLDEVRCVRSDLTDECQAYHRILDVYSTIVNFPFRVWSTRPTHRGIHEKGVSVGTFFCSSSWKPGEELSIACLKNLDPDLHAMPNLEQVHSLINHYGPRVYFHPDEAYLPSSVSWFFENGALLFKSDSSVGVPIDINGSNLPKGGTNDGEFWIDLPKGEQRSAVKFGNLESAKLYVHVKPAFGGTFTDLAMWVFCPFNGPATLKIGLLSFTLSKIGQHLGDWEHFTLRICNFDAELWGVYYSQHSGGEWVLAHELEYIEGNKPIVYSTKNGHASFPHPGTYIQGSKRLGIGIRNDAIRSDRYVNSSTQYEIVSAEYLGGGDVVVEPCWLQFMRKWGPRLVYDSRTELEKIIKRLPTRLRSPVENVFGKLPLELSGEDGPTGPKEKNNWVGDERWVSRTRRKKKKKSPVFRIMQGDIPHHFSDYGFDPQIDYFQLMEEARNHTVTTRRPIDDDYMSFKLRKPVIDESHSRTTPFKKRKRWWKSKFSFFFNLNWIHRRRSHRKEDEEEEEDVHRARARDFRSGPVYMTGSIGAPNSTRAYSFSGPVRYWDMDLRYVSLRELHMEQQKQKRVRISD